MSDERPLFRHPPWMVGIMLILGAMSLFVGLTVDPFWLVMGAPAILTLLVYVGVRIALSFGFGVASGGPADGTGPLHEPEGETARRDVPEP
jgi:predicted signal transduction protein with EAL and GGDEF domain